MYKRQEGEVWEEEGGKDAKGKGQTSVTANKKFYDYTPAPSYYQ